MSNPLLKIFEDDYKERVASLPEFAAGDTINVSVKITEGNKERIQQYQGVVIQIRNSGNSKSFTVRKNSSGTFVERIFPFNSPSLEKVEVLRRGKVRRARLFYLREARGKAAKIKERRG